MPYQNLSMYSPVELFMGAFLMVGSLIVALLIGLFLLGYFASEDIDPASGDKLLETEKNPKI